MSTGPPPQHCSQAALGFFGQGRCGQGRCDQRRHDCGSHGYGRYGYGRYGYGKGAMARAGALMAIGTGALWPPSRVRDEIRSKEDLDVSCVHCGHHTQIRRFREIFGLK